MTQPERLVLSGVIHKRLPSNRFNVLTSRGESVLAEPSWRLARGAHLFGPGDIVTIEYAEDHPFRIMRREAPPQPLTGDD